MTEITKQNRQNKKTQENLRFLSALLKNGASSDREIAKQLKINNSSASKRRKEIEQEGYINEYTVIPNFNKIGIETIVFSFGSYNEMLTPQQVFRAQKWMSEQPEVLCCMEGQGLDSNFIMISAHKNYEGYLAFLRKIRNEPQRSRDWSTRAFTIDTGKAATILKPFSLKKITSILLKSEAQPYYSNSLAKAKKPSLQVET